MEIPHALREAIQNQLIGTQQDKMIHDAQAISLRYRNESGMGKRLLTTESEAVAYSVARMPVTFSAIYNALEQALFSSECIPETLLDVGAGTGAATWAADAQLDLKSITCLEREDAMCHIGQTMMKNGSQVLCDAKWMHHDLIKDEIPKQSDLVIASYVLNEITEKGRIEVTKKLWDSTKMMLLIVEPGTPIGFSNIIEARKMLLGYGANIVAPCAHKAECTKPENDWCHFTCRVSRTRLHKQLKGGEAPFEDEKFIYVALTREKYPSTDSVRVLRHPQVRSGHVTGQTHLKS